MGKHLREVFMCGRYLVVLMMLAAVVSCRQPKKKPAYTIGFSQCIGSDLWRKTMLEEMKTELSLHPEVNFLYADAQGNSKKQIAQVGAMLQQGIDLLIISPNEAQPLTAVVEETYNKGIPVIVIDRKTASSLYTAYVGADNYELGKMAGEYVGSTFKGQVELLEIMGLPGSSPAIERDRGFNDGVERFPRVHIVSKIYGDWLKQNAEDQLLKAKAELPFINTVFAHNDVMASGARHVFDLLNLSRKVKVIGVDALPGTGGGLQMVTDKTLDASLMYPTGGKEAIVTAFRILNKEPFERENILQSLVIDSTNVQLMKMQWNKIRGQQKDIEKQQALLGEQEQVYKSQQQVLNVIVITLVLTIVFGGLAFYFLMENQKINKSLEIKNNEILMQRNQLIEISAKAQVATEAKLNFFTNISHEFRTPLTLILLPLEDLIVQTKNNPAQNKNLKLIHKNVIRLLRYVNQLIEYRKIEYDKLKIRATENNLVPFVKEIVESFHDMAAKKNINLQFTSFTNSVMVWFDVNMLDKVVFNLLSNAFKFTKDNGTVKVTVKKAPDPDGVLVQVEDSGIGMTEESVLHAFDMFYQADSYSFKGSGLGLSLSKEFMNLHKGDLRVKSKKNQGTTFTIYLRTGGSHLLEDEKYAHKDHIENIYEQEKIYSITFDDPHVSQTLLAESMVKEQSILIIEDNTDLLSYLTVKFESQYEVFSTSNGNEGYNLAFEKIPDLIISDVVLPEMSGTEISNKLKSDVRTSHIPIILLTAKGSVEQQITGIQSMADLYITKPFNFDYVFAAVQNLMRNREILKEHFTSDISASEKLPVSKSLDKRFVNDFAKIVEQNLSNEKFDVEDICKIIGISRVQLYRKVKALLGCSITDYILNRRLKKAKYLLNNENYTIAEIAYLVGFSNPNYFSTVFKAKYECTPSEFKKNNVNLS
jgi:signal transduction histidine kinase/DNA-binding response OmpR family regulator/ABC-type xylose transport system substrate-binding protein